MNHLDCYPLLWVYQDLKSMMWSVNIKQKVACKYIVIKCIDRHGGQQPMYMD